MPVNSVGDAIKLEGLEKSFGDWPVLWDLDLTLGWGQFLVLFGANGVGKSTLLRILSTQARADAGKALIAGHDLRRNPQAVRSRVGVVAHQTFLYDDLTALENLVLGTKSVENNINAIYQELHLGHNGSLHPRVQAVLTYIRDSA